MSGNNYLNFLNSNEYDFLGNVIDDGSKAIASDILMNHKGLAQNLINKTPTISETITALGKPGKEIGGTGSDSDNLFGFSNNQIGGVVDIANVGLGFAKHFEDKKINKFREETLKLNIAAFKEDRARADKTASNFGKVGASVNANRVIG